MLLCVRTFTSSYISIPLFRVFFFMSCFTDGRNTIQLFLSVPSPPCSLLKSDYLWLMCKRRYDGSNIFQIKDLCVLVIYRMHVLIFWVGVKHGLPCLCPIILNKHSCHPDLFSIFHGTYFHFSVGHDLSGHIFSTASLNIKLSLKNMY